MSQYVVLVGGLEEGIVFHGPFNNWGDANTWPDRTKLRGDYYTEVLPLIPVPPGTLRSSPHVLVHGDFDDGFKVEGPFDSYESAETQGDDCHGHVVIMPLEAP